MDTSGVLQNQSHISKLAISSLIISLLGGLSPFGFLFSLLSGGNFVGLFYSSLVFSWPLPIVAIVVGILSLMKIHKHPDLIKGKGIAWLGIVMGCLTILAWIGLIWILILSGISQ